jgi:hypothetical protein
LLAKKISKVNLSTLEIRHDPAYNSLMSDSGFSGGLPPGAQISKSGFPPARADLRAEIIQIKAHIKTDKVRIRMQAEVVSHNKDGTSNIRTDKGDIVVKFKAGEQPAPGDKLEIEIPQGKAPKNLVFRSQAAAAPSAQTQSKQIPANSTQPHSSAQTQTITPDTRPSATQGAEKAAASARQQLAPSADIQIKQEPAATRPLPIEITPVKAQLTALPPQRQLLSLPPDPAFKLAPNAATNTLLTSPDNAPRQQAASLNQTLAQIPYSSLPLLAKFLGSTPPLTQDSSAKAIIYRVFNTLPFLNAAARTGAFTAQPASTNIPTWTADNIRALAPSVTFKKLSPGTFERPAQNFPGPPAPALLSQGTIKAKSLPENLLQVVRPITLSGVQNAQQTPLIPTSILSTANQQAVFQSASNLDQNVQNAKILKIIPPPVKLAVAGQSASQNILNAPDTAAGTKPSNSAAPILYSPAQNLNLKPGEIASFVSGLNNESRIVITVPQAGKSAPDQFILQQITAPLPTGTAIILSPDAALLTPSIASPLETPGLNALISGSVWPSMDELAQTLQTYHNPAQLLAQTMPSPAATTRMPAAILFFISAIRAGDLGGWLGDKAIETLRKQGKSSLVSKIGREFTSISRAASEPVYQDWRAVAMPMYYDGQIHKLQLYYKKDQESTDKEDQGNKTTRFIFDLSFDKMGPVQIDGLHRPGDLSVLVRTNKKLSAPMQQKMRQLYTNALELAGVKGELGFQNDPEKFIKIDLRQARSDTLI